MFRLNQQGAKFYANVGVETGVYKANPHQLIIMLYEGAISACQNAINFMKLEDIEHKGLMLSKAIMIIESGLRLSLDKKAGGEIAENLDALYIYMRQQLFTANLRNESALVLEVVRLLTELKSAWESINIQAQQAIATDAATPINNGLYNDLLRNRSIMQYAQA
jgi:flagellar protein FliS